MAQAVEHILGKDEVTSSNLVSSSKTPYSDVGSFCVDRAEEQLLWSIVQQQEKIGSAKKELLFHSRVEESTLCFTTPIAGKIITRKVEASSGSSRRLLLFLCSIW